MSDIVNTALVVLMVLLAQGWWEDRKLRKRWQAALERLERTIGRLGDDA